MNGHAENSNRFAARRRASLPIMLVRTPAHQRSTGPGVVNHVGAVEAGAKHGGIGYFAAVAAADAGLVDRGNRVIAQRIVRCVSTHSDGQPDSRMQA